METLWIAVGALVGLLLLVLLLALANGLRLSRKPGLTPDLRIELQASLLEEIKRKSADQGTIVDIRPFWRGSAIKPYQRNSVIRPLIEEGHVRQHDQSTGNEFYDTVRNLYRIAFHVAPTHLILTDRTWVRMVHEGLSGTAIVIGEVQTLNWQEAGGDIVHSPQTVAGRDADVRTGKASRGGDTEGVNSERLLELVAALRRGRFAAAVEG